MIRINDIIDKITDYNPDADLDLIDRAYVFSAKVHDGQVRLSGEPYLSHPLEVAGILADMKLDVVSVAAGLLHDVIEDTHATAEEIEAMFGPEVRHIVSGVTKLSTLPFGSDQAREAENIRKMLLAMADDIRVVLIKLADRMHNMRTLQYHSNPAKQRKIARETLDIYAAIAARLGIFWIKNELENIAFKYILPEQYQYIESMVAKGREEREKYIETVKTYIQRKMDENDLPCEVMGRYKNFYSIHQKMEQQHLEFEEVYDIIAFRIILDTIPQCYEALGLVHALWKPIAKKFKDYIAMPKPNMYQSLHTTVIGPYGERIEIQIRTRDMDQVAKSGIAAHWSYKEGRTEDPKTAQAFAWVQNIVENQANIKDPDEFLENVRIDLFPDDVYVFTPKGEIKSLPKGATPVDFAYAIHSEVGDQCVGAKVNGRMVPLKYELQTGESVAVITQKGHHPSKDWLSFAKTVKARSKIRQWIKTQEKERSLALGQEMCEKAFRKVRLNFNTLAKSPEMEKAVTSFGLKTVEDLIIAIGYGKITPLQLVRKLMPKADEESEHQSLLNKLMGRVRKKKLGSGVVVKGVDDIMVRFGKCCQPVPGDNIVGYITRGFGVTVHRAGCVNARKTNPERLIEVEWDLSARESFPVKIKIRSMDRMGLLADVAATINKAGANIISANTQTGESKMVSSYFTLSVADTEQLDQVLAGLRKIKNVLDVERVS
ncbi:RelA/SpoT family protein [Desulfatitalea alkaliphila]|uniref:Bifunctional (P)ppGpp synthetase/guanosine-3',5'-bis(Diphosphate) 3'-pyrophosphohydrolase n=1 Tax=Desulfatitalea alkaliphila TaxID=2929485 RepID=A0AA41R2N2_9BACT|nr:bifunctional (p)ppGpp synthetase/guanosine-3',5'-bis(diphosphate) 3'-pyrophosphohydrolase [Desulfatitalea alkaliphila]MCJ8500403.1 bifunctional (p)ppGpp synthetase/guanosine-3',5'-bis(diphosphate) 3'-pyrophosphohydrolase [Desulfatitalea alkaliphila]